MAKNREDERMSAEEQAAREAVRSLRDVPAPAEFRSRIGDLFASGGLDPVHGAQDVDLDRVASPPPLDADAESVGAPTAMRRRASWIQPLFGTLAAAAIILVVFTLFRPGADKAWQVAAVSGYGAVFVDDSAVSPDEALSKRLASGARVRTEGNLVLELVHDGFYALELGPERI
ncbi:MAG: hypothetical protein R3E97_12760 [Candidatus Eisenbacteria bacterium]